MKEEKLTLLRQALENAGVTRWEIMDVREEGWEFYLIGSRLDQHRVRDVNHVKLRVMTEDGGRIGAASGEIAPTAGEAEMAREVAALRDAAGYALNPAWPLNRPWAAETDPAGDPADIAAIAGDFLKTLQNQPYAGEASVNSSEVFVTRVKRRFLNSEGVDVSDDRPVSMAEVIVNAHDAAHEIELYRMFRSGACDAAALRERLALAMRIGRDKLAARPTPALGRVDLVLSTEAAVEVYDWYLQHLNAAFLYQKYSDWQLGVPVADGAEGDRVTITARRTLPNSSRNVAFDDEGGRIRDRVLLRDNVPEAFYGSRQFGSYMGLEDCFQVGNVEVSGGSQPAEALRAGDYLEAVEFSDFQVDPVSGDLAGEIRLGYLHRGGETLIVSGGSVTGSMDDFVRTIRFSRERCQYDHCLIPAVTRLTGVTLTGGAGE